MNPVYLGMSSLFLSVFSIHYGLSSRMSERNGFLPFLLYCLTTANGGFSISTGLKNSNPSIRRFAVMSGSWAFLWGSFGVTSRLLW